ncbi:unnamed protein product [Brassicogethes aeneus]|uniref:Uncharacterized protein n=1 Tax=Brassicogethes aeneus TaxID=1431903 RepID=A0A9P0ASE4_BRAAE|nr:unnamed protein product [Brassicogethes aeneus]
MSEDKKEDKKKKGEANKNPNCSVTIGPGPNKYELPPVIGAIHKKPKKHDFTRYQNPAWSMQPRRYVGSKFKTPSPGDIGNLHRINPPAYTIKSRHPPLKRPIDPALINLRDTDKPRAPIWTLHLKPKDGKGFQTPGPSMLPSTLNIKHYTLKGRYPGKQTQSPPLYDPVELNIYKNKKPAYSIRPRIQGPKPKPTPGPGDINDCFCNKNRGFQFGLRTCTKPYITKDDEMPCQDIEYY